MYPGFTPIVMSLWFDQPVFSDMQYIFGSAGSLALQWVMCVKKTQEGTGRVEVEHWDKTEPSKWLCLLVTECDFYIQVLDYFKCP